MSGDGYVGKLLELHKGCQVPFLGSRGKVGFLSRLCSRKGENLGFLSCGRTLGIPLELRRGPQGPTRVASGKSSLHSSCKGALGIPLQLVQGTGPHLELRLEPKCSSSVLTWISGFLWSFNRGVRPRLVWRHGTLLPSRGVKGVSGFFSSWHRDLGLFLKVPRGCHTSLRVLSQYSQFQLSQCRGIRLEWMGKLEPFPIEARLPGRCFSFKVRLASS